MKSHNTSRQVGATTGAVASLLIAVSASMALVPALDANARPVTLALGTPSSGVAAKTSSARRLPPAEVARALEDGVYAGRYTVLRADGKKGKFYVFSDPSCGYCRRLEKELDSLGRTYTIHLFPVSVVGVKRTYERVHKIMCAKPKDRMSLWRDAVDGRLPTGPGCADGDAAIEANNRNFLGMGFDGTPIIVSENGEQLPDSYESAADISRWLEQQAARR